MQLVLSEESKSMVIDRAVAILARGGILVYPSDTVYGLAVDATNSSAVLKIDKLKNRRADQKYSFNFSDLEMIKKFCNITSDQERILKKYLPGPYTFILTKDIAVRIPKNNIITDIAKVFGKPITATSANITGKSPATSTKNMDAKIYLASDLIIEKTDFEANNPSTIVDISTQDYKVIRQGAFKFP